MIPVFPFAALRRKLSFTPSQPTLTESPLGIANKDGDDDDDAVHNDAVLDDAFFNPGPRWQDSEQSI